MSDNNLRLQVILNAVDKLTSPFRAAQASSKELAGAIQNTRNSLKELNKQAGRIDEFRKTRSQLAITANNLNAAREEAAKLATQFAATNRPTAAQAKLFSQAKTRVQELQQTYNGLLGAVQRQRQALKESGIDTRQLSSAQRELKKNAEETRQALEGQQKALKRLGEQQARMNAAREQYSRRLEVRDRIAGAGATTTAAGLAMGAPVMAAVKSYTSMEDAMKGVAKQVNGLRDDNGNRTARFYEMQDAIKAASEQLPMENGAVDFAALVEGGARMNVANPDDSWEDQKRDLLAFASTAAKAATAFELPADELSESLGKIAQLYKIPTRNIEQLGDALNYLDDNAMSKGADIIDVMQRLGGVADRLDYRKAAALGSTFLTLGAAPEVAASAANAMVRELSIATMQSKSFFEGMNLLKLNPEVIEKQMTKDAMGTIQRVLENPNQQRVVLAGWRTTGTAATRACFIGQRSGFTYCAVVVFASHGITDGECPENCSRCAGCTIAVWIIRFTCCCCDVYESSGGTARWTGCRRRGASCAGIRSAGDAARCPVCHIWSVRCSAQSNRSCGYCTGRRGAGYLEILATHHRISRWRGGRIQSGGRSHQCCIRTT